MPNLELTRSISSTATPALLLLLAAMSTEPASTLDVKPYRTSHTPSTASVVRSQLSYSIVSDRSDFAGQMAAVYADLLAGQTSLGADFEAVWDANARELYEA